MNPDLETPVHANVCSWRPQLVTLVTGEQVPSDSAEWLAECEARHMLSKPFALGRDAKGETRRTILERIGQRRGPDALEALKARMDLVEPSYVLSLPNKFIRNAYLDDVRRNLGENTAEHLRNRVMALHTERKASIASATEDGA